MWVQVHGADGTPKVWRDGSRAVQCMAGEDGDVRLFAASRIYALPGVYDSLRAAQMAFDANPDKLARLSKHVDRPLSIGDVADLRTGSGPDPRGVVHDLVAGVAAFDEHEARDKAATLRWVRSGAPLFRTVAPATPDKHLCAYIVLLDEARRSILLIDHVKAGLWLPPGGHVDDGEDPRVTVIREAAEELGIDGELHPRFGSEPLFLTVTQTRGEHSHTDVTFWFVLAADQHMRIEADPTEANAARWFDLDDPEQWAHNRFDPHMARFRVKLLGALERHSAEAID